MPLDLDFNRHFVAMRVGSSVTDTVHCYLLSHYDLIEVRDAQLQAFCDRRLEFCSFLPMGVDSPCDAFGGQNARSSTRQAVNLASTVFNWKPAGRDCSVRPDTRFRGGEDLRSFKLASGEVRVSCLVTQRHNGKLVAEVLSYFGGVTDTSSACFCSRLKTVSNPTPAEIATRTAEAN